MSSGVDRGRETGGDEPDWLYAIAGAVVVIRAVVVHGPWDWMLRWNGAHCVAKEEHIGTNKLSHQSIRICHPC